MTAPTRARAGLPALVAVALVVSAALLLLGVILETSTAGAAPNTAGGIAAAGHNEATEHGGEQATHSDVPAPTTAAAPTSVAATPTTHNEATEHGGEQGEAAHPAAAPPLPTRVAAETASTPAGTSAGVGEAGHSEIPGTVDADNGQGETVLGIPIESPVPVGVAVLVSLVLAVAVWRRPIRPVSIAVIVVAAAAGVLDVAEIIHQLGAGRTGLVVLAGLVAALHLLVVLGAGRLWVTRGARPAPVGT